ncbi:hypothetical protein H3221_022355 [Pseudomonas sp. LMG 31766]|uniref:Uncharacterized protein n=1 Tax=Pseudomonas chaetocerotis TaxID=2758695 RepID=A0A931D2W1_9PSED|nr:hypothetical protein [Pseudomonas chaetocerotis]MBZ9667487.1 hypothetical protein [Pseudomonas chaetocerotis]
MKMAKPSARDIEAAEELHQLLQMLDARFGGPFQNHEAGDDLAMLLDNGDNAFDSDNLQHLQTLYNHLARLLRNAPNFYGRVIGGMVWVIMNEANQILDPESDCIDLHPRFQQMADQLKEAERGNAAFNAVIQYMLGEGYSEEPMEFLRVWNDGNFDALRNEWPKAPAEIYYADPLADHGAIEAKAEASSHD